MKTYKIGSLYDGTMAGIPDYFVNSAVAAKESITVELPSGHFMVLTPEQLKTPNSTSEKNLPNRHFPGVGEQFYSMWNYIWKEGKVVAPVFENKTYKSLEDLKEVALEKETLQESVKEVSEIDSPYMITQTIQVPTLVRTPVTLNGYIGHIISSKREELKLTDKEVVAKILQKDPDKTFTINTYRYIERGEDTNSKLNTYTAIAKALDIHISDLFPPKNG